jgi:hypothetical protein
MVQLIRKYVPRLLVLAGLLWIGWGGVVRTPEFLILTPMFRPVGAVTRLDGSALRFASESYARRDRSNAYNEARLIAARARLETLQATGYTPDADIINEESARLAVERCLVQRDRIKDELLQARENYERALALKQNAWPLEFGCAAVAGCQGDAPAPGPQADAPASGKVTP